MRTKLFAVATLSTKANDMGGYNLMSSLVLAVNKTAAIKLAVKGVPRGFRNHECQVAEATPEFIKEIGGPR